MFKLFGVLNIQQQPH